MRAYALIHILTHSMQHLPSDGPLARQLPAAALAAPPARGCTCDRLRRLTRRVTAVYDHALATAGLRVTQFSMLAQLRRATSDAGLSMGDLASQLDMDRTTLTRNLKPLVAQGWVALGSDAQDGRLCRVQITPAGDQCLRDALPHWRRAQATVNRTLGDAQVAALHHWLDDATPRFRPEGPAA